MSSTPEPENTTRRRVPSYVWALVAVGFLWGGYQLVMAGVRAWVDRRIEQVAGQDLVEFALPDLDGEVWRASDLRGRHVVLHFFRSNCSSCLAEREAIHELEQRIDPERAALLGVLLDTVEGYPEGVTAATLERLGFTHPVLIADADFVDHFHGAGWAHVTPVTYVVDREGRITSALRGRQSVDQLASALPPEAVR